MKRSQGSSSDLFSQRKKDHIAISLRDESQSFVNQFDFFELQHDPLPEINFADVDLSSHVFGYSLHSPHFVSSMTLGHGDAEKINHRILKACAKKGWMMGVGSQRRQLFDSDAYKECEKLRSLAPEAVLFGNIGLSQIIDTSIEKIESLVGSLVAQFLVVHTNPLQEVIQVEGTPQFRGGLEALEKLCKKLSVPVVLKETGCGFSQQSFEKLKGLGLSAIDVSGKGGTHWGRVEGLRLSENHLNYKVARTFSDWGLTTVDSLMNGVESQIDLSLWASGGVRSGLETAKLLALGAEKVGFARPILEAALQGEEALAATMEQLDHELKVALFCLGCENIESLVGQRSLLKWK